jgi:glycosyltransferase involved in cell wall biosynthesis
MGGLETYVRALVPALLEERPDLQISLWVNQHGRRLLAAEPWAASVDLVVHPLLGRAHTRAATETTLLGWLATRSGVDVLHSVALTAPFRTRPANVLTVADVTWLRAPDPAERLTGTIWRVLVPRVARHVDRLIVLSEATRQEVVEDFSVPAERIDVVPLGPGTTAQAPPTPEPDLRDRLQLGSRPIVLAVSALKLHKNVATLLDAIAELRRTHEVTLVVPGNHTHHYDDLAARAHDLGLADSVVFPGWLGAADLEGLYRASACFVCPSLREGFGLPILEAMQRGVPVACAEIHSLPEVAGDAAVYFDPRNAADIARALRLLLDDRELAETLAGKGRARAAGFSWRRTARETLASYERARARA